MVGAAYPAFHEAEEALDGLRVNVSAHVDPILMADAVVPA